MHIQDDPNSNKILRIKKSIFSDVLQYNKQAALQKAKHYKYSQQIQQRQFQEMTRKQRQLLQQEDERKQKYILSQKNMLKIQYDRQINEKKQRQRKVKQHDKMYADLELSYKDYQNQRRLYDLQRIYNRRRYKAELVDTPNRRFKTQFDQPKQQFSHNEFIPKTPEYGKIRQGRKQGETSGHRYHDSLDNLKFQQNPENSNQEDKWKSKPSNLQDFNSKNQIKITYDKKF